MNNKKSLPFLKCLPRQSEQILQTFIRNPQHKAHVIKTTCGLTNLVLLTECCKADCTSEEQAQEEIVILGLGKRWSVGKI